MTESVSCITSTTPEFLIQRFSRTVGAAVPNTVLKIIDPESKHEIGADEAGEENYIACGNIYYFKFGTEHIRYGLMVHKSRWDT